MPVCSAALRCAALLCSASMHRRRRRRRCRSRSRFRFRHRHRNNEKKKQLHTCHMPTCHATPHPRRAAALRDTHSCMHLSARKLALVVYPILTTPILSPPYLAPISLIRHLSLLSCSSLQSKKHSRPHPVISSSCRAVTLPILSVTLSSRHPVIYLRRLHRRASYSRQHHVTWRTKAHATAQRHAISTPC
jgi:hypothetical protein